MSYGVILRVTIEVTEDDPSRTGLFMRIDKITLRYVPEEKSWFRVESSPNTVIIGEELPITLVFPRRRFSLFS